MMNLPTILVCSGTLAQQKTYKITQFLPTQSSTTQPCRAAEFSPSTSVLGRIATKRPSPVRDGTRFFCNLLLCKPFSPGTRYSQLGTWTAHHHLLRIPARKRLPFEVPELLQNLEPL